jgi:hypothetical protein
MEEREVLKNGLNTREKPSLLSAKLVYRKKMVYNTL